MRRLLLAIVLLLLTGCSNVAGTVTTQCDGVTVTYTVLKDGMVVPDTIVDRSRGLICKHDWGKSAQILCVPTVEEKP
jgi:uncharacterized protein YceK